MLIAGPTASGKTQLALHLAEKLAALERPAMLINADSMQVYRDLQILTARPRQDELGEVAHRLFGHVDVAERYSTGRWLGEAAAALEEARELRLTPIFVGGTGLYFKALTEGLSPMPKVPAEVRARVGELAARAGPAGLAERLAEVDPQARAAIRPSDTQRLARALEIFLASGRSILEWRRAGRAGAPVPEGRRFVLLPEREALYGAIEARFEAMMEAGALEEARALRARGLAPDLPAMKAIGVPPLMAHLAGEIGLAEAVAEAQRESRRYAKRQLTWLRHQLGEGWTALGP